MAPTKKKTDQRLVEESPVAVEWHVEKVVGEEVAMKAAQVIAAVILSGVALVGVALVGVVAVVV